MRSGLQGVSPVAGRPGARSARPGSRAALLAGALLVFAAPTAARGALVRSGAEASVRSGEQIEDDVYLAGSTVTVEGTVAGDLVAAGGTVTVSGRVEGDLWVTAGNATVTGQVLGSVRVAAGTLVAGGSIGEDLLAAAGELRLAPTSSVGRDLWLSAGEATAGGRVGRDLHGAASRLVLDGEVAGRARLYVDQLQVTQAASIGGDLLYTSPNEADRAPGARIGGQIERTEAGHPSPRSHALAMAVTWLRTLAGLFLFGLLFLLLFPRFSLDAAETAGRAPGRSLGFGALVLFATPFVALAVFLLGLLLGGWWIALFLLALYALFAVLALPTFGLFLGRLLLDRLGRPRTSRPLALLVGLALLLLVLAIPVLGALAALLAIAWGLGALAVAAAGNRRTASVAASGAGEPRTS